MEKTSEVGYGYISHGQWQRLVRFRLFLPTAHATMLLGSLFHAFNGRVKSATENYARIGALHPKKGHGLRYFF